MDSTENVPARIQAEAKAKALAILATEPNCISYVRPEDLETAALFIPVVSIIKPTADDFYPPIPKVGIMAKPQLVNLLKEKAGINITRTETSKRGDYVYVAHVWGEKRQPDGTMLTEDASYEFDCNTRAELDFIGDPDKYKGDIAKCRHLLELAKFGEQRAVTGAQHSLIHKLAHVARSFQTPEQLMRGMKVLRIDRNVNGIMADPSMLDAVIQHALGATETVFGRKAIEGKPPIARTYDEEGERIQAPAEQEDMFPELEPAAAPEPSATDKLKETLRGLLEKIPPALVIKQGNVRELIQQALDRKESTEVELNSWIDRCQQYFQKRKGGAA
jgi:hypothetical protein